MQRVRTLAVLVALMLAASSCGSGDDIAGLDDDGGSAVGSEQATAGDAGDAGDDGDDAATTAQAGGPITGPIVSVLSFDFGMWTFDPDTGEPRELAVPGADYSDRLQPAMVATDRTAAYVIAYTEVEDQTFTQEVSLATVDLATGDGAIVTTFGRNRADDDDTNLVEWTLLGADSATVWVDENAFSADARRIVGIDRVTGSEVVSVDISANDVFYPVVTEDGMYAQVDGVISRLDGGTWSAVKNLDELAMADVLTPDTVDEYAITRSGADVDPDWADSILTFGDLRPYRSGWTEADGALYWVVSENFSSVDGDSAIVGGFVRFDLATAAVTDLWSVGDDIGAFLDENTITTLGGGSWAVVDGIVWFGAETENGKLFRVDPTSGVTAFDVPVRDGVDYTEIELIASDPDALWVDVTEWVVTQDDENGRQSSGTSNFERFDTRTGASVLVVPEQDLTGF